MLAQNFDTAIKMFEQTGKVKDGNSKLLMEKIFNRINAANDYIFMMSKLAEKLSIYLDSKNDKHDYEYKNERIRDHSNDILSELTVLERTYDLNLSKEDSYPDIYPVPLGRNGVILDSDYNNGTGGGTD